MTDFNTFQPRCRDWAVACLDEAAVKNTRERTFRFLEEALELGQATGATREDALQLVDYVFGRPVGEPFQEVGGTMTTLASLCNAIDINLVTAAENELFRCWVKINKIRAKALSKRTDDALPGVGA